MHMMVQAQIFASCYLYDLEQDSQPLKTFSIVGWQGSSSGRCLLYHEEDLGLKSFALNTLGRSYGAVVSLPLNLFHCLSISKTWSCAVKPRQ